MVFLFFCLGTLFPGNESNGCEILCPAVNNAVCKKCEQGTLDEALPVTPGGSLIFRNVP